MSAYNGWTNYATWRINLEWFDGVDDVFCDAYKGEDVYEFANNLKEYVRDCIEQVADARFTQENEIVARYALAFLDDVNWREIAEHLADDNELFTDEDDK